MLDTYTPEYHFHGHTEEPFTERLDHNGKTRVIKMADLHWDTATPQLALETGAMGILRWRNEQDHSFSLVDAVWLNEYNAKSWSRLR